MQKRQWLSCELSRADFFSSVLDLDLSSIFFGDGTARTAIYYLSRARIEFFVNVFTPTKTAESQTKT